MLSGWSRLSSSACAMRVSLPPSRVGAGAKTWPALRGPPAAAVTYAWSRCPEGAFGATEDRGGSFDGAVAEVVFGGVDSVEIGPVDFELGAHGEAAPRSWIANARGVDGWCCRHQRRGV
jgi:hypothetical protein